MPAMHAQTLVAPRLTSTVHAETNDLAHSVNKDRTEA